MAVEMKIVKLPACVIAGGYQTDITDESKFYQFTQEQFGAIFALGKNVRSFFFTGSKPMHIFGTDITEDSDVKEWMTKREIPAAEYVFFSNPVKKDVPYNEGELTKETWDAVRDWMQGQREYVWSNDESIPNMIVASTDEIGYQLYRSIMKF